jgi:hypothetical protein
VLFVGVRFRNVRFTKWGWHFEALKERSELEFCTLVFRLLQSKYAIISSLVHSLDPVVLVVIALSRQKADTVAGCRYSQGDICAVSGSVLCLEVYCVWKCTVSGSVLCLEVYCVWKWTVSEYGLTS